MNPDVKRAMQELEEAETKAVNDAAAVELAQRAADESAALVPVKAQALADITKKTYGAK
jgi:hypothetical protein